MDETNDAEFGIDGTPFSLQPQLIKPRFLLVPVTTTSRSEPFVSGQELSW